VHDHPNHIAGERIDLATVYRREAHRLLSLGELGTRRTRYSLIELARLYDALASHVEARAEANGRAGASERAEVHDRAS